MGTVADLSERKGVNYLIEVVASLPAEILNHLNVIIVGDGPEGSLCSKEPANFDYKYY